MDNIVLSVPGLPPSFVPFAWVSLDRAQPAIYAGFLTRHEAAMRFVSACLLVALPVALSGCHLLDQTDIDKTKPAAVQPPPISDPESRPALVTIEYIKANPEYRDALKTAIRAAETRRPGLLYDVVALVGEASEAPIGRGRAADVMTVIEGQGVIPARIQLGLRLDPGRKVHQVRVYLR